MDESTGTGCTGQPGGVVVSTQYDWMSAKVITRIHEIGMYFLSASQDSWQIKAEPFLLVQPHPVLFAQKVTQA